MLLDDQTCFEYVSILKPLQTLFRPLKILLLKFLQILLMLYNHRIGKNFQGAKNHLPRFIQEINVARFARQNENFLASEISIFTHEKIFFIDLFLA